MTDAVRWQHARTGDVMDPTELQAKATIAAALIVRGAVEVPTIAVSGDWQRDAAAVRLRELTDYVYQTLTAAKRRDPTM
jgi:hypothetical protein